MEKKSKIYLYPILVMGLILMLSYGCKKTALKPDASFSCNGTTLAYPSGSVSFMDNSKNSPTSWYWVFGDGGTSTEQNPVHTYYGSYYGPVYFTVTLTVSNDEGSSTVSYPNYIRANGN